MNDKLLLIIDDEPDVLEVIEVKLEHLGCTIKTALNAEEGYEMIKELPLTCVLCDILLPGMTGIDLIKKCRGDKLDVPFIFYSGAEREQFMQDVLQYGAFDFVSKPELSNLEEAVLRSFGEDTKKDESEEDGLKEKLVSFLGVEKKTIKADDSYQFLPAECKIDIESIDKQHDTLFKIIDEIKLNVVSGDTQALRIMKRLQLYLKEHLRYEEELFEKFSYPEMNSHKDQHVKFQRMTMLLQNSMHLTKDEKLKVLEKFRAYCLKHFTTVDAAYSEFLREAGVK